MAGSPFLSRLQHFGAIDSTQRAVREWLDAGVPEVCVAVADSQTRGRGRLDRGWVAPPGAALLLSVGFRPLDMLLRHGWRLAAIVALAMLDAAEEAAGLRDGTLWLKWPNDLVAEGSDGRLYKVAGVLGETAAEGDRVATAVVGIGTNVDWVAAAFPADLHGTMSSLRELSGGRPVDRDALLDAWLARLEPRYEALRAGTFDAGGWSVRQCTTNREVEVDTGREIVVGRGTGVDPESGALVLGPLDGGRPRSITSGDVVRCRVVGG